MMRLRRLLTLCCCLLTSNALAVGQGVANPESAWRQYLASDRSAEPRYRFPYANCFRSAATNYDLPETVLLAVARGESDFDPMARSKANAHGVMQIQWPTTARHLGINRLSDLYDACTNIDAGARYLRELLTRFDGNLHLALAAYNYGPERIAANPGNIPSGASWYSGYIYRHLNYVLGDGATNPAAIHSLYSELGHSTLVEFGEPYRAEAFVERLETKAPEVRLDWFRKGVGKFSVVMTYADRDQFNQQARLLARAGFPVQ
jgi:Transglycosylase SLT domain